MIRHLLLWFIVSVHGSGDVKNINNFLFSGSFDFFDLTHKFDKDTVYFPNSQNFTFTRKIADYANDGSWYAANDFCAGEHGGTHLDAPYHFAKNGSFVGDLPLNKLILPLIIADVSSQVNSDPNFVLYKHHLDYMVNNYFGQIKQPCLVLFKFGWAKHFGNRQKYLGLKENDELCFPGISAEVADWIVSAYPNIVGVAVDVASVDPGSSKDYPVHKKLMTNGIYALENVNLQQELPDAACTAFVMPMKIAKGSGAPLRLVAICPKQIPQSFHDSF